MAENEWLARQFETNRDHLRLVAQRMLGSTAEAEDAVQEAWLRLNRSGPGQIENLTAWLTTVVARVCLDALRSRKMQEHAVVERTRVPENARQVDAEKELLIADSIGAALLVVLDTLEPAERVAFVLHDMFDMPFDEIGTILGRAPGAARQLASRARRRVQGGALTPPAENPALARGIVSAFLAAARGGDLGALLAVLDPSVILRADETAVETAAANKWGGTGELPREARGAPAVAAIFDGRSLGARPALIDGMPGAAWVQGQQTRAVWEFSVDDGKIVEIVLSMDPARLAQVRVIAE
jgi:RNA polymerase sigma factor (sigma-70 family)